MLIGLDVSSSTLRLSFGIPVFSIKSCEYKRRSAGAWKKDERSGKLEEIWPGAGDRLAKMISGQDPRRKAQTKARLVSK